MPKVIRLGIKHCLTHRTNLFSQLHSIIPRNRLIRCNATSSLLSNRPLITLERAVGKTNGADEDLWKSGTFTAEVYPDLPIPMSVIDLFTGAKAAEDTVSLAPGSHSLNNRLTVQTVAAQCRSLSKITSIIETTANSPSVDAILFVSGSHPLRRLPGAQALLPSSFDLLKTASTMRQQGTIPDRISLWAVENPSLSPVDRLARKLESGAQVCLTQPPFLSSISDAWFEQAAKQGISDQIKIVAGIPMITSVGNLEFWLTLCDLRDAPAARDLIASFPAANGGLDAVREWNRQFINKVSSLPGVSGYHVMPLTKTGRQLTSEFMADGLFKLPPK